MLVTKIDVNESELFNTIESFVKEGSGYLLLYQGDISYTRTWSSAEGLENLSFQTIEDDAIEIAEGLGRYNNIDLVYVFNDTREKYIVMEDIVENIPFIWY